MGLDDNVTKVVSFIIAAVIGLLVLNALMAGIAYEETELQVYVEDGGTAQSNQAVELYNASDDTLIANKTTDSNGEVNFSTSVDEVYAVSSTYTSDNITLDQEYVRVELEITNANTIVDYARSGAYYGIYDDIISTTQSVYGLLLVLPLILIGAVAIGMLGKRMGRGR